MDFVAYAADVVLLFSFSYYYLLSIRSISMMGMMELNLNVMMTVGCRIIEMMIAEDR